MGVSFPASSQGKGRGDPRDLRRRGALCTTPREGRLFPRACRRRARRASPSRTGHFGAALTSLVVTEGSAMRLAPLTRLAPLARLLPLAAVGAVSLALAACDPGAGGSTTPTPSGTYSFSYTISLSPSASPSVTPSPPAHDPHPPLAGLVITTSGLLPLTIGQAIVGNPGEAMLEWNATACDPAFTDPAALGRWQAAYPEIPDHGRPFLVDGEIDGVLRRIDINSPALSTREGIHQGSPI